MNDVSPTLLRDETADLAGLYKVQLRSGITHKSAGIIARKLGCIVKDQKSEFGFWHPSLKKAGKAEIEFFLPVEPFHYNKGEQHLNFHYWRYPLSIVDDFAVGAFEGVPSGDYEQFGMLYQFRIHGRKGKIIRYYDPMASSLPYGLYAPAEVYDLEKFQNDRNDSAYYKNFDLNEDGRVRPSTNILEIHVPTATSEGSLQSLTKLYQSIAGKIKNDESLSPYEQHLTGFDAIELMPIEPVAQHTENQLYWDMITHSGDESVATVHVKRPDLLNWGYDVAVFGTSAINPSLLGSGRPHELRELTETLHNFPGKPVKIILDIVLGHAEKRASGLLPEASFTEGINKYGLNLNYNHPVIRGMLLEMLRRKINWGVDGIRVDASHDFKNYDSATKSYRQDDKFLDEMSRTVQSVSGRDYKSWMIYEDGRPWPDKDWVMAATFRDLINRQKNAFQWGPLTFAFNKPYTYTFWISNWWRIQEICKSGERWITGFANHDTVRRVVQENPDEILINHHLGDSPKAILHKAYNNPAASLLFHGFLPGVPMDFINSLSSTPWCFFRNTDEFEISLKVIAEETYFFSWQVEEQDFRSGRFFRNLKHMGFDSLRVIRKFMTLLSAYLTLANHNIDQVVTLINSNGLFSETGNWTVEKLKKFMDSWITDIAEYCSIHNHSDKIQADFAGFQTKLKDFRRNNRWLQNNFTENEILNYSAPLKGSVICYGYREHPGTGQPFIIIANIEGRGKVIRIGDLNLPVKKISNWKPVLHTPGLKNFILQESVRLKTAQGFILTRTTKGKLIKGNIL